MIKKSRVLPWEESKAENSALVVLNFQRKYFDAEYDARDEGVQRLAEKIVPKIISLAEEFRKVGAPVIYVNTVGRQGDLAYQNIEADIRPDDTVVNKKYSSALDAGMLSHIFGKTTDLHKALKQKGVETLFIAGAPAWGDVISTAFDAVNARYNAYVVKDAIGNDRASDQECNKDYVLFNLEKEGVPLVYSKNVVKVLNGETDFEPQYDAPRPNFGG